MSLESDWKKIEAQLLRDVLNPKIAAELESAFYLGAYVVLVHYTNDGDMSGLEVEVAKFREEMINGSS